MRLTCRYCDVCTVHVPFVGADAGIKDNEGKTPLQWTKELLSCESKPDAKQDYEKVHEYIHAIYTLISLLVADRALVQF